MINYYKTVNGRIEEIREYEKGCWINCVAPEDDEVQYLLDFLKIPPELMRSALDDEESSHVDSEDNTTLIIIDVPVVERVSKFVTYSTMPIGIMITDTNVITVAIHENTILSEFSEGVVKNVRTDYKTHFVLHIMLRMATKYLQYLKQIDKVSNRIERQLRRSAKNKELHQLLDITERGRSLGIILFSVEQFRSAIHDRVKGNCATSAYGRTNAIEVSKPDYRYIPKVYQNMMTRLPAGEYIISNPALRSLINIKFPYNTYKQFPNG